MKQKIKEYIFRKFNTSFSKSGDDIQLSKLINSTKPGAYVDIGCWHPVLTSNSYYFSLRNWKGICIDPNPELKKAYAKIRPKDIFINKGVSDEGGKTLTYYMIDSYEKSISSMNTFDVNIIKENNLMDQVKETIEIPTVRLDELLPQYITENDRLDFFDVDAEGFDLEVLKSNDWNKFRPKIILVESFLNIKDDMSSDITAYLESKNYSLFGKSLIHRTLGNLYFIDNNAA